MSEYPEHEKLKSLMPQRNTVQEFLDWLEDGDKGTGHPDLEDKSIELAYDCDDWGELRAIHWTKADIIGKFLGIDPVKLEVEKRQMLDEIRGENK